MSESINDGPEIVETAKQNLFRDRLKSAWALEFSNLRWRLTFFTLLARLLPRGKAARLRTVLMRAMGLNIGSGTRILGIPRMQSSLPGALWPRLQIGSSCMIGVGTILEFGEQLSIGDRVSIADGVVILTSTHQLGSREHRAGPLTRSPVVIGNDVEIGAGAIILPGVKIGDTARILPGAVVNSIVAAKATVSGIPARPLRQAP